MEEDQREAAVDLVLDSNTLRLRRRAQSQPDEAHRLSPVGYPRAVKLDSLRWSSGALLLLLGCDDAAPAVTADAAVDVAPVNDLGLDAPTDADELDVVDVPDVPDVPPIDLGAGPIDPARWPVDQPGPFRVGFRSLMHTYTPAGTTTPRTIKISFWYPTLVAQGTHPTYSLIFTDRDAWVDAPPAAPPRAGRLGRGTRRRAHLAPRAKGRGTQQPGPRGGGYTRT